MSSRSVVGVASFEDSVVLIVLHMNLLSWGMGWYMGRGLPFFWVVRFQTVSALKSAIS